MLSRILVPLDGSTFAESALPAAIAMARRTAEELRLVTVLEKPPAFVLPDHPSSERVWAEGYLKGLAERAGAQWPGRISTVVREGWIVQELEAEAREWKADLMIMSTHGRTGLSRLWLGSVSDRCLRSGFRPVLMVRPPEGGVLDIESEPVLRRVVVPLDGSELAERAMPYAQAIVRAFHVPVLLLRAVLQPPVTDMVYQPDATALLQLYREQARAEAEEYLSLRVRDLLHEGIDAYSLVDTEAGPAGAILARERGDLVVMSTHGRGKLDRTLFGSVADKVVRGSHQPVLVIPPEGPAWTRDLDVERSALADTLP